MENETESERIRVCYPGDFNCEEFNLSRSKLIDLSNSYGPCHWSPSDPVTEAEASELAKRLREALSEIPDNYTLNEDGTAFWIETDRAKMFERPAPTSDAALNKLLCYFGGWRKNLVRGLIDFCSASVYTK
ncbi:MAG: hypothetical protein JW820_07940 [Spirochaetales bacterium]|nr:hypothetical protein [Spirochaetales bacterium]